MNPIPLTAPDGTLYGYACGNCHTVCTGGSCGGPDRRTKLNLELSLYEANRCCVCRGCGGTVDKRYSMACSACEKKQQTAWDADAPRREAERAAAEAEREANLSKAIDRDAAILLESRMSDISEDCYAAGWMGGLETRLWQMVIDKSDDHRYGMGIVSDTEVDELRRLSEKAGGWWSDYEEFMPLDEWRQKYQAEMTA